MISLESQSMPLVDGYSLRPISIRGPAVFVFFEITEYRTEKTIYLRAPRVVTGNRHRSGHRTTCCVRCHHGVLGAEGVPDAGIDVSATFFACLLAAPVVWYTCCFRLGQKYANLCGHEDQYVYIHRPRRRPWKWPVVSTTFPVLESNDSPQKPTWLTTNVHLTVSIYTIHSSCIFGADVSFFAILHPLTLFVGRSTSAGELCARGIGSVSTK